MVGCGVEKRKVKSRFELRAIGAVKPRINIHEEKKYVEAEGMENDLCTVAVSGDPLLSCRLLRRNWSEVQHMRLVRDTETTWRKVSRKVTQSFCAVTVYSG
ncbi:uncharacterized [Tachysurus ichikawai]